ncbi:MAG: S8 family serine peptidase [Candidatus Krumholzibacteria bacterium]|nr:S8 family serine peptidase [Candidatus Krumholzibacteria bacterium]
MRWFLLTVCLSLLLTPLWVSSSEVHLRAGTMSPESGSLPILVESDTSLWVLCFLETPGRQHRQELESRGAEVLGYLPENAYLLRCESPENLDDIPGLAFRAAYLSQWKMPPGLQVSGGMLELSLDLLPDVSVSDFANRASALGAEVLRLIQTESLSRVQLRSPGFLLEDLCRLEGLRWMEPLAQREERLNDVCWVVQAATKDSLPVWDAGVMGENQVLGHIDSGLQYDNCFFADPDGNPIGPDHRKIVYLGDSNTISSHGTHTAGILAGDLEAMDWGWEPQTRGMAPKARFAHSAYSAWGFDLFETLEAHHSHGARIHSNSWGDDSSTDYTQDCRDIDAFSWQYESDLVVFAETNQSDLRTPENAKNVLAVAGSHNGLGMIYHGRGGTGPTTDGRRKPEIYAPGVSIQSAYPSSSGPENPSGYCRTIYTSGTSMACPAVAGSGALIRQYFEEGWYPSGSPQASDSLNPSGSLVKAMLLNSTRDMTGIDGYPGDLEGWGRLQLDWGIFFGEDPRRLYAEDVLHAEGLETGEESTYSFEVFDSEEPLSATLVFHDYPGELSAAYPVVNNLDLEVESPSGLVYPGNSFKAGYSSSDGEADSLNTVERVLLPDPELGLWTLRVIGREVPMGPQGYALAVSGPLSDNIPVALGSFQAEVLESSVRLRWQLLPGAASPEFRVEVEGAGLQRTLEVGHSDNGLYVLMDDHAILARGGVFRYELFSREGESDWQFQRGESLYLEPADLASRLLGAWPNPFNPRTLIQLEMKAAGQARLAVYDLSGRLLRLLLDESVEAGRLDVTWDGRDEAGQDLSSGVYFLRFESRGVSEGRKLVLIQ